MDVVFLGHTHAAYACEVEGHLFVSAGRWGEHVADVDLVFDPVSRRVIERSARLVPVTSLETVPAVDAYLAWLDGVVGPLAGREVGRITEEVSNLAGTTGSRSTGYLVADAMLAAAPGADLALTNPGGLRAPLSYAASGAEGEDGVVTYAELFALLPFGNAVLTMTLTGAQLEALLEQQLTEGAGRILQPSASLRYTLGRTPGDAVDPSEVFIGGAPLELGASYRVVVNDFLAEGGDGFSALTVGTDREPGVTMLEATAAYLAARSPYTPPPLDRITRR